MANQYQLHTHLALYQLYGIHRAQGPETPPPSAQTIYAQQKKAMQAEVVSLNGSAVEAAKLEHFLNFTDTLAKTKSQIAESRKALFDEIRAGIADEIGHSITETLSVADDEIFNAAQLRQKEQQLDQEVQKLFKQSDKEGSISLRHLEQMVQRFEKVHKSIPKTPTEQNEKVFENAYNTIRTYINQIDDSMKRKRGTGISLKLQDFENVTAQEFIDALNRASSLITYGSLSRTIGQIGEYYGAATAFLFFNQKQKGTQEILQQLFDKKNPNIQITGDDKSMKIFTSDIGTHFTKTKTHSDINNNLYVVSMTDDKVDFTVTVPDARQKLNFSMKNYANASEITLLKGNIFPILDEYPVFLYHFLNLSNLNNNSSDASLLYQGAKYTVAIKALIGGVRAMDASGHIFKTAKADYLMVNTNTQKQGIRVYATSQICQKLESHLDALVKFSHRFDVPVHTIIPKEDARFANMHVTLRMNELKRLLKSGANKKS